MLVLGLEVKMKFWFGDVFRMLVLHMHCHLKEQIIDRDSFIYGCELAQYKYHGII